MLQTAHRTESDQTRHAVEAEISAWIDGQDDIRPEDLATSYGRHVWDTYHLIGDVLRNDSLALRPSPMFYARLSKAIDAEPPIVAPVHGWSRRTALSGLIVAAAVALVAWIVFPYFTRDDVVRISPAAVLANSDAGVLGDYLEAHRDIIGSGAIQRTMFGASRP